MGAQLKIVHEESLESAECSECATKIYLLAWFIKKRRDDHKVFYCPNGHNQYFPGETEAEKLKKELDAQKRRTEMAVAEAKSEAEARKRETTALKGKITKLSKRVANGVCPVPGCGRHFTNVERHVATKHPGFKDGAVETVED
jgi:hypothetical protein